jgi:NAD(P)-dependent dehydrogenase (short-subunit alcohol dehydrogenase family)
MMLEGKVAVVTGAGSGLGEAISILFAKNGATVVLGDLDIEGGERVLGQIEHSGSKAKFVKTDVSSPSDAKALVDAAVGTFGQLDIAVNNAGIGGSTAPLGEYPLDGWDRIIAINLSGVFFSSPWRPRLQQAFSLLFCGRHAIPIISRDRALLIRHNVPQREVSSTRE